MVLEINILEVIRTSFTLWILIFCSILALGVSMERWWFFRRNSVDVNWFMKNVKRLMDSQKFVELGSFCDANPSSIPRLVKALVSVRDLERTEWDQMAIQVTLEERIKFERSISILGTLGSMSPFVGLFGTVLGIIHAFHQLAVSNAAGGASVVAAGISEALVATAAGIFVAIPCIILFNYFGNKIKRLVAEMQLAANRLGFYMLAQKRG